MQLQRRGIDNRSIHEHWFVSFPWLQLDTTKCIFTCKTCQQADVTGSPYFNGTPAQNPKKSNFEAHESSLAHKEAWTILEMAATGTTERYGYTCVGLTSGLGRVLNIRVRVLENQYPNTRFLVYSCLSFWTRRAPYIVVLTPTLVDMSTGSPLAYATDHSLFNGIRQTGFENGQLWFL